MCRVLVLLLTMPSLHAQSPWKWLNPKPQGNRLYNVEFLNDSVGHACGEVGSVIRTTNGGITWYSISIPMKVGLFSVFFVDESVGYAGGDSPYYWKTTDGGQNWVSYLATDSVITGAGTLTIDFPSSDIGYLNMAFDILRTTDGGDHWSHCADVGSLVWSFDFLDDSVGYLVADNGTYKTTNAGTSWLYLQGSPPGWHIDFLNEQEGYVQQVQFSGPDKLFKTTNGGQSWISYDIGNLRTDWGSDMSFANQDTGFVVTDGSDAPAVRTTNGGQSWQNMNLPQTGTNTTDRFRSVHAVSNRIAYICGDGGYIWKTTDAGQTWVSQRKGVDWLVSVTFVNERVGFGARQIPNPDWQLEHYYLVKTTDGGQHWYDLYDYGSGGLSIYSSAAPDTMHVYFGSDFRLIRSTNGGESWAIINLADSASRAQHLVFPRSDLGYFHSLYGLWKSTNAGTTWLQKYFSSSRIWQLQAVDTSTVFVAIGSSVLKTTDGGENWQTLITGVTASIYDVSFVDGERGYAVGGWLFADPAIVKTTDGGTNWIDLTANLTSSGFDMERLELVDFVDENEGYIEDIYGKIARTTDGGESWVDEQLTSNSLSKIDHLSPEMIYARGSYGTIIVRGEGWITDVAARAAKSLKPPHADPAFQLPQSLQRGDDAGVGIAYGDGYPAGGVQYSWAKSEDVEARSHAIWRVSGGVGWKG